MWGEGWDPFEGSQEEPRRSQEEPGGARGSQEELGSQIARRSQEEPGGARGSP